MTVLCSTRNAYGEALLELGACNPRVLVLDADLSRSTCTAQFGRIYPDRFFNVGIAEQHMIGMAAGLAAAGWTPFATTYAIFIARALDQIRQSVCFNRLPVKIVATHGGLSASHDGGSHQGIEDLALMRAMVGMTVLVPSDASETRQAIFAAAEHPGPVYLRLQKHPAPDHTPPDREFRIGLAHLLREGNDIALCAIGAQVQDSLYAAEALGREGVEAAVLALPTLSPLDVVSVRAVARRCGSMVTIEEHLRTGGLRDVVLQALAGDIYCPVESVALDDYSTTGEWHALRSYFGIDVPGIVAAARRALQRKA